MYTISHFIDRRPLTSPARNCFSSPKQTGHFPWAGFMSCYGRILLASLLSLMLTRVAIVLITTRENIHTLPPQRAFPRPCHDDLCRLRPGTDLPRLWRLQRLHSVPLSHRARRRSDVRYNDIYNLAVNFSHRRCQHLLECFSILLVNIGW